MRIIIILSLATTLLLSNCNEDSQGKTKNNTNTSSSVIALTNDTFKQKVFNYEINKQWKFEGDLPVIIDFYADWCGPCRQLSPKVEEIAKEYVGKIVVYKVDTDAEKLLAQSLGVQNLPTLLFIPAKGQPQTTVGALSKDELVKAVHTILLVN